MDFEFYFIKTVCTSNVKSIREDWLIYPETIFVKAPAKSLPGTEAAWCSVFIIMSEFIFRFVKVKKLPPSKVGLWLHAQLCL